MKTMHHLPNQERTMEETFCSANTCSMRERDREREGDVEKEREV